MELRNRRVTIMGLGCHGGGVAAARFCAAAGAIVTVTDLADETKLAESLAQLGDAPIAKFTLGRHGDEDFRAAEIVVVNPAVRPGNRLVELARQASARILSEIELFLDACPATVIAVTGTVGKSTTAAMLATIFQTAGRRAWLGGNIGHSLLGDLPKMQAGDVVVLELSSFQLHWLSDTARWPLGAIITNCLPNHLDWHGTWEQYVAAKQRLLTHLPESGFCVLNTNDAEVNGWSELSRGKLWPLCESLIPKLQITGEHNIANAVCAATAANGVGIAEPTIARALAEFTGLPHRNRMVGEQAGRVFINDSKSTTPTATLAALASCIQPTWLLLGGADTNCDFNALAEHVIKQARGAAVFGAVAEKLHASLRKCDADFPCVRAATLQAGFKWCLERSEIGDAILLSPACPSTDQFRDFAERGETFERLVGNVSAQGESINKPTFTGATP